MSIQESFAVLGIVPTKDAGSIKTAYREKLRTVNPEDNPEGFKRLRAAYDEANAYATRSEEEEAVGECEKRDETPSGIWLERVKEIYGDLARRVDVEEWREVFADDVFFSLEEEENCREKCLCFLMDHYRLPTKVWKLLDEKLNIVRDAKKLREYFRADFIHYVVSKCEHGEEVEFEKFEGAPDADYDLFLNFYDECWRELRAGGLKKAEETLAAADTLNIYHPAMECIRLNLAVKQKKIEEAISLAEGLLKRHPEDEMVRYHAAETFWGQEKRADAAAIYEGLKEENDTHYMANYRLTEWYEACGEYKKAKKCAEGVLRMGADDSFFDILMRVNRKLEEDLVVRWEQTGDWDVGMELGWCLLQDGRFCEGIQLTKKLQARLDEQKIELPPDKKAAYYGLLTKLYTEEAEFEDAIYMAGIWEKSLEEKLATVQDEAERERDRDRIFQAHMIRIQCSRSLGFGDAIYFDKALEECDRTESGTVKDIPVLMEKAQVYLEKGEYELCREVAERLVDDYQVFAADSIAMEAWRKQWDAGGVIRHARRCLDHYPDFVRGFELLAEVYLALDYREELKALLQEAEENKVESVLLDAARYRLEKKVEIPDERHFKKMLEEFRDKYETPLEMEGRKTSYQEGLPILTEYLYWRPDSFLLWRRGKFHICGGHYREGIADLEKALMEEPGNFRILREIGLAHMSLGEYETALPYIKRALWCCGEAVGVELYADLAQIYTRMGEFALAEESYRRYAALAGTEDHRTRQEAQILALCGKVQEAYSRLEGFYGQEGMIFAKYRHLVWLLQVTGQREAAKRLLREWCAAKKVSPGKLTCAARYGRGGGYLETYAGYYSCMGWQELLYGNPRRACFWFVRMWKGQEKDRRKRNRAFSLKDAKEGLCEAVFACILAGDHFHGRRYAGILRAWRKREEADPADCYYRAGKERLHMEFLSEYYFADTEELGRILDREPEVPICRRCTYAFCRRLETARILLLIRQNKHEEAVSRLRHACVTQPQDEYAMALQRAMDCGKLRREISRDRGERIHDSRN